MSKIEEYLYLGSLQDGKNRKFFERHNIRGIISIIERNSFQAVEKVAKTLNIECLHINVADMPQTDLLSRFEECYKFINKFKKDGSENVFVHCLVGFSRSPTIVISYLMKSKKMGDREALKYVRERRYVNPNIGFQHQLQIYSLMKCDITHELFGDYTQILLHKHPKFNTVTDLIHQLQKELSVELEKQFQEAKHKEVQCKHCRVTLCEKDTFKRHMVFIANQSPSELERLQNYGDGVHLNCNDFIECNSDCNLAKTKGKKGEIKCPKCQFLIGRYNTSGLECTCKRQIKNGFLLDVGRINIL
ncbi:hypothetical protein SNEBB_009759 [Seison nebaliae]|nr:hypothetical protein SNEBB_009759 [Seison nebaliae]